MKYRQFGQLDWNVSILGLGLQNLPVTKPDWTKEDAEMSVGMARQAIDQGVNYIDLGFPYQPEKQKRLGKIVKSAITDKYKQKTKIAITLPIDSPRSIAAAISCSFL